MARFSVAPLADAGFWRGIFFINLPIGLISLFILWKKVPESRDEQSGHAIDYAGSIAIIAGLALLTFGFLKIPETDLLSPVVCGSLGAGLVALLLFIFIEKKSRQPMMPLQLFRNKTFSGANLLTFFLYAGLFAGMLFLTLNMVQIQGYSQLPAGLTLLPFTFLIILISRWSGTLTDKYGPRRFLIGGPLLVALGFFMLSFVRDTGGPAHYWSTYFPGILVFGLGMSFTVTPLTTTVMGALPNHFSGTASGINNALSRISNVFTNAIVGALAILFFSGYINGEVAPLPLSQNVKEAIISQAANLGEAEVPAALPAEIRKEVAQVYREGFIDAYTHIMRLSAGLALIGALMGFIFIKNEAVKNKAG